jgi:hypothetical protein
MKYKLFLLTSLAVLASFLASASDAPPGIGENDAKKNDVVGGVYHNDSKKPLDNVSVTAYSASKKEKVVITDANGNYSFADLKPGTYKFVFEKGGFKKVTREKTISKVDEAHQLNINMEAHSAFEFMPGPSHFFDF